MTRVVKGLQERINFLKIKINLIILSDTDCKSPLAYPCLTDRNCEISLYNEVSVDDCNGDKASYIGIEYRNIPSNIILCKIIYKLKPFILNFIQQYPLKIIQFVTKIKFL